MKAVVTSKEAGLIKFGVSPARYDEAIFCYDRVRHVGDNVAAVAAVDIETARKHSFDQSRLRRTPRGLHHRAGNGRRGSASA